MAKKDAKKKPEVKKETVAKKPTPAPKKPTVKLDPNKFYDFVVSEDGKKMKKGTYRNVDGVMAQLLTDKGIGSVRS